MIPVPAEIDKLTPEDGTLVIVEFDMLEYQKKHNSRTVIKALNISEQLNEEAMSMVVNFSQVLQEALINKLNIGRYAYSRDEITEDMKLTVEEARALTRFLALEDDRREIEAVKYYLLGGRGAVEIMELLGIS